ncbi:MAG: antitoxin VapB family protein [Candidatus Lokiarchaeota archaeon]|nr:antitoxin VapB family protein [Candidatus Harpocratesius repetitus]
MASHQISIRDDVYKKLNKLKMKNESFSDLLDRLSQQVKGSWHALEQLNGIAGPDELNFETIISENRKELEKLFKNRLGIRDL